MVKDKLCFFLLNYQQETHRHYYHIYEFIEEIGKRVDLRLMIMETQDPPVFDHVTEIVNLTGKGVVNIIRRNWEIIRAWKDGYRIFYHHYTMGPARFSALVNRMLGGRTYLWHCIIMEALEQIVRSSPLNRLKLNLTFKLIHRLITGSEFMAQYYADRYWIDRSQVDVIPNYINLRRFNRSQVNRDHVRESLGIPAEKKMILYLHEIEEGRASRLPQIIRDLCGRRNDLHFIIAGDGRYRKTLETELAECIGSGVVKFVGKVPNIETPHYYAAADVYIMTSSFEAFSRVLLEAMAMGVPYVATDGGGSIRSYTPAEHQSFILSDSDFCQFAQKIETLIDHPMEAEKFRRSGYRHVEEYSLDHVADKFIETVIRIENKETIHS